MRNNTDTNTNLFNASSLKNVNEISWHELYPILYPLIRRQVYALRVSSWYGQENEIIDDIVQEAMRRMIERIQRAEQGQETPIQSLEHMIVVIACNYCRDLRRRDKRFVHSVSDGYSYVEQATDIVSTRELSEEATEQVYQEALFTQLAQEVVQFPCKQREALLVDLANRMSFEEQPTALQKAFLRVGIRLQDYQQVASQDSRNRARQAALLHHAYKRVSQLTQVQQYAGVA